MHLPLHCGAHGGSGEFLLMGSVRLGQAWLRPERFATVSDVVANTVGAAVGALLASALLGRRERVGVGPGS